MPASGRRWRRAVCVLAVLGTATSACTETVAGVGRFAPVELAPDAQVTINGLPDDGPTDVDRIAANAVSDIQDFWAKEMPKAFGTKYRPISGGIYSVDPHEPDQDVPCVSKPADILGNAFYCPQADAVAWDRVGLLPSLRKRFGTFPIAMVLAHELGHAVQARTRSPGDRTIVVEAQADCYAGAWTRAAQTGRARHFRVNSETLDDALSGYLLFRDPVGSDPDDQHAHGNAFDRVSAFQEGYEHGVSHCKSFDDSRKFTELPFQTRADAREGGNMPFSSAIEEGSDDLATFWESTFPDRFGKPWAPVRMVLFDSGSDSVRARCDGDKVSRPVRYCASNNTLFADISGSLHEVYSKTGDFGPMVLIAVAYGQAVRSQTGRRTTGRKALASEICLAGGYAGAVSRRRGGNDLILSPGDLDEAVQALLAYGGAVFDEPTSTGFRRIKAFRQGFADVDTCT